MTCSVDVRTPCYCKHCELTRSDQTISQDDLLIDTLRTENAALKADLETSRLMVQSERASADERDSQATLAAGYKRERDATRDERDKLQGLLRANHADLAELRAELDSYRFGINPLAATYKRERDAARAELIARSATWVPMSIAQKATADASEVMREACAKLADNQGTLAGTLIASAIRARGEKSDQAISQDDLLIDQLKSSLDEAAVNLMRDRDRINELMDERDAARAELQSHSKKWSKHRDNQAGTINTLNFRVQRWKKRSLKATEAINEAISMLGNEISNGTEWAGVDGDPNHALSILRDAIRGDK